MEKKSNSTPESLNNWMTYEDVKKLFNYGATKMSALIKLLVVSQVGRRKFVLRSSVEQLIDQNRI